METILIVVVLLAIAGGLAFWARGRGRRSARSRETDTAWRDPTTPGPAPDERVDR